MNKLKISVLILLSAVVLVSGCKKKPNYDVAYRTPVKFELNKPIKYPDFELTHTGVREIPRKTAGGTPFTELLFDFKIKNDKEEKTVSWSNSVGIISPVNFEMDGAKYSIEMMYSAVIKSDLAENVVLVAKLSE